MTPQRLVLITQTMRILHPEVMPFRHIQTLTMAQRLTRIQTTPLPAMPRSRTTAMDKHPMRHQLAIPLLILITLNRSMGLRQLDTQHRRRANTTQRTLTMGIRQHPDQQAPPRHRIILRTTKHLARTLRSSTLTHHHREHCASYRMG